MHQANQPDTPDDHRPDTFLPLDDWFDAPVHRIAVDPAAAPVPRLDDELLGVESVGFDQVAVSDDGMDWLLDEEATGAWCGECGGPCTDPSRWELLRSFAGTSVLVGAAGATLGLTAGVGGMVAFGVIEFSRVTEVLQDALN